MNSFGIVLSALRKEMGYSQRRVASDLGVSQALLSHYENGAREPKLDFVVKVCDYFSVTADYILGRIDERAPQTLPAPRGCDNAQRFVTATQAVFSALDEFSNPDIYAAAVNYLLVPAENAATMLNDPEKPYEPRRDAELKLAEAELITLSRRFRAPDIHKR